MASVCVPNEQWICVQCNMPLPKNLRRTCRRRADFNHINSNAYLNGADSPINQRFPSPPRRGIGSFVASLISKLGIKKKPGCGCGKREEKLNRWGWWLSSLLPGKSRKAGRSKALPSYVTPRREIAT
jgi:hypothetical protein